MHVLFATLFFSAESFKSKKLASSREAGVWWLHIHLPFPAVQTCAKYFIEQIKDRQKCLPQ